MEGFEPPKPLPPLATPLPYSPNPNPDPYYQTATHKRVTLFTNARFIGGFGVFLNLL